MMPLKREAPPFRAGEDVTWSAPGTSATPPIGARRSTATAEPALIVMSREDRRDLREELVSSSHHNLEEQTFGIPPSKSFRVMAYQNLPVLVNPRSEAAQWSSTRTPFTSSPQAF